ncbi:MAG: hypothetical protein Q9162_006117 [Coniocarpon cinnabarinum]
MEVWWLVNTMPKIYGRCARTPLQGEKLTAADSAFSKDMSTRDDFFESGGVLQGREVYALCKLHTFPHTNLQIWGRRVEFKVRAVEALQAEREYQTGHASGKSKAAAAPATADTATDSSSDGGLSESDELQLKVAKAEYNDLAHLELWFQEHQHELKNWSDVKSWEGQQALPSGMKTHEATQYDKDFMKKDGGQTSGQKLQQSIAATEAKRGKRKIGPGFKGLSWRERPVRMVIMEWDGSLTTYKPRNDYRILAECYAEVNSGRSLLFPNAFPHFDGGNVAIPLPEASERQERWETSGPAQGEEDSQLAWQTAKSTHAGQEARMQTRRAKETRKYAAEMEQDRVVIEDWEARKKDSYWKFLVRKRSYAEIQRRPYKAKGRGFAGDVEPGNVEHGASV